MTGRWHKAVSLGRMTVGTAFALHGGISLARWDTGVGDAFLLACTWLAACLELIAAIWFVLGVLSRWVGAFLLAHTVMATLLLPWSDASAVSAGIMLLLGVTAFALGLHGEQKTFDCLPGTVDSGVTPADAGVFLKVDADSL